MGTKAIRALVTAGGTREPIDEVRYIGNHSTGAFGIAIGRALLQHYVETTVIAGEYARGLIHANEPFVVHAFDSFHDLDIALACEVVQKPDIIFMTAAVADYSPRAHAGKISSDADELVITLHRNPKLIGRLREQYGIETFLVGFKLLAGATRAELIAAAQEQIEKNRLNLVVANDLTTIREGAHPIVVVTPEGGVFDFTGLKEKVAQDLVKFVLERRNVTWVRSEALSATPPVTTHAESHRAVSSLLDFAQQAHLLPDTNGNVSHRADRGFWITPRHVKKDDVRPDDLIFVRSVFQKSCVEYEGSRKPSIDAPVHAFMYDRLPRIQSLLHFHDAIVITELVTRLSYPCGTVEEAQEIVRVLSDSIASGQYNPDTSFAMRLVHHGYLVGFDAGGSERLAEEWSHARARYREHLHEIGYGEPEEHGLKVTPVFAGASVIGVWAYDAKARYGSCFIVPEYRKQKWGSRVLAELKRRGLRVAVHDDCRVLDYYRAHGWKIFERRGALTILVADGV